MDLQIDGLEEERNRLVPLDPRVRGGVRDHTGTKGDPVGPVLWPGGERGRGQEGVDDPAAGYRNRFRRRDPVDEELQLLSGPGEQRVGVLHDPHPQRIPGHPEIEGGGRTEAPDSRALRAGESPAEVGELGVIEEGVIDRPGGVVPGQLDAREDVPLRGVAAGGAKDQEGRIRNGRTGDSMAGDRDRKRWPAPSQICVCAARTNRTRAQSPPGTRRNTTSPSGFR